MLPIYSCPYDLLLECGWLTRGYTLKDNFLPISLSINCQQLFGWDFVSNFLLQARIGSPLGLSQTSVCCPKNCDLQVELSWCVQRKLFPCLHTPPLKDFLLHLLKWLGNLWGTEHDIGVPLKAEHPQSLILCSLAKKKSSLRVKRSVQLITKKKTKFCSV